MIWSLRVSVSDPYHFDADPDPQIRFRDDGSGSERNTAQNPTFYFPSLMCSLKAGGLIASNPHLSQMNFTPSCSLQEI